MKLLPTMVVMLCLTAGSAFSEGLYNPRGVAKSYVPQYSNGSDMFLRKDLHQPFQTTPSDARHKTRKVGCKRKTSRRCVGGKPVKRDNKSRSVFRNSN